MVRQNRQKLLKLLKENKDGEEKGNFMVRLSFYHDVELCEQYPKTIRGKKMADIVENSFPAAFEQSVDPRGKRFLMDGCPRQNCKLANLAYDKVGGVVFKIPPRSPDLNPIENFFNLVTKSLNGQAISRNITHETFQEFSERVKNTLLTFNTTTINNLIGSMGKRVEMILLNRGNRIRY